MKLSTVAWADLGPPISAPSQLEFMVQDSRPVLVSPTACYPLLNDTTEIKEHFAIVRARLLNERVKSGISSVLISSALRQEGKSFTALNLAMSLAKLEKGRVLLVDADLRMRTMSKVLRTPESVGLSNFLRDRLAFAACVRRTTVPGLYVVPAGTVSPQLLPGILEGARLPDFMRSAKQDFDMVVVDSVPASVPLADFELLLSACDGVILVARLRKTTPEALERAVGKSHSKLLAVIANNAAV